MRFIARLLCVFALSKLAHAEPANPVSILLGAGQFTCLHLDKHTTDLHAAISADGEIVRRLNLYGFSTAPARVCFLAERPRELRVTVDLAADFYFEPARTPSSTDQEEFIGEQALLDARKLAADPNTTSDVVRARFESARANLEKSHNEYDLANAHRGFGDYLIAHADALAAVHQFEAAVELFARNGWRFEQAIALQSLGYARNLLGEYRLSLAERDESLKISRALGDTMGEAYGIYGRAEVLWRMGELQNALTEYNRSLAAWRKLGNRTYEAQSLNALGLVNNDLGRYAIARQNYDGALKIWQSLGDRRGLMMTINNTGLLREESADHAGAREKFTEALDIASDLNDLRSRAYMLQNIGDTWAGQGNHQKAIGWYQQSIAIKIQLHDAQAEAESHRKLGLSLLALNRLPGSASEIEMALATARRISDRTGEAQSLAARARWNAASGSAIEAERNIGEAIGLVETTRLELHGRELRTSFFSRERDFYDLAIDLALAPGGSGPRSALGWSERSRARTILDAALRSEVPRSGMPPGAAVVSVDAIQSQLLDAGTALVEYSVNEDRAIAFIATRTDVRAVRLASPEVALRNRTSAEYSRLASAVWWPLAINPAIRRVAIAAEGRLARVPFAVLPSSLGGPLLVEKYELTGIPSASLILARRGQRVRSKGIAVFADPVFSAADPRIPPAHRGKPSEEDLASLRFTREEALELARLGGPETTQWLGFDATSTALRAAAAQPGAILHIGTHAIVESSDPLASRLVLSRFDRNGFSQPGELSLSEIFGLAIRRDLVVLAGCRTGDGREVRGEGLASLARAFLYAGAHGLIGTLWDVDDRMASDLIRRFYQAMLKRGLAPAAALRAAQLAVLRQGIPGNSDWAAFVYSGDWQQVLHTHAD
jgi:CHAT domain-containing protein